MSPIAEALRLQVKALLPRLTRRDLLKLLAALHRDVRREIQLRGD